MLIFTNAPSLSTLTHLNGWFSLFYVVRVNQIILNKDNLDTLGNNHINIVFGHTSVRI